MKKLLMISVLLIVGIVASYIIFGGSSTQNTLTGNVISDFKGEKVQVDNRKSSINFTAGKVVGKSHLGTFQEWESFVYIDNGKIGGLEGIAQVASVKTDSARVDSHLQNEDFFESEIYPEIKFTSTKINSETNELIGILELHGTQNEVQATNVVFTENSVSGSFVLDAKMFNFKYDALMTDVNVNFNLFY